MSSGELARFLHAHLRQLGMTRTEVARRSRLSRETLNKLLQGQVAQPSVATLLQLADAVQVAPLHLVRLSYGGARLPLHSGAVAKYPGDHACFVRDVTYPDNSMVMVEQEFDKVWDIQNTGNVTWRDRSMRCVSAPVAASLLDAHPGVDGTEALTLTPLTRQVALPETVPGATARVTVRLRAPPYPCSTLSHWRMVDAKGDVCLPELSGIWCLVTVVAI